jgi:uncharacterized membrane protein YgaE (UPF0421/DUF939 family)
MSDILLGVIIGGLIASITPIVMIILEKDLRKYSEGILKDFRRQLLRIVIRQT